MKRNAQLLIISNFGEITHKNTEKEPHFYILEIFNGPISLIINYIPL